MREPNFDDIPFVAVKDALHKCACGWDEIALDLQRAVAKSRTDKPILVVECFPGADELTVLNEIQSRLGPTLAIHAAESYHSPERINKVVAPFLRRESRSHRPISRLSLVNFFDAEPLWRFRRTIDELKSGLVLIVGCGASLIAWGNILVYADLARREARKRLLQMENRLFPTNLENERSFLTDSGVADRWKRPLIKRWDFLLDTHKPHAPKMAYGPDILHGLNSMAYRPLRIPACADAARDALEERSVSLGFGELRFELPAIDLIFAEPQDFLGETVYARFGPELPIRFDFAHKIKNYEPLYSATGWREERATFPEQPSLELRRHTFSKIVTHKTRGSVNVLNLVEGHEAIIESPDGAFEPMILRHADTAVVPAGVGRYTVKPNGPSVGKEIITVKAFVKTQTSNPIRT